MDKKIIKNNANNILKNNKYYYIIISGNKIKIISKSTDKTTSKNNTILFLKSKINKLKLSLPKLYTISIKKNKDKQNSVLVLNIQECDIKFKKDIKIKCNKINSNSNIIYIDNKFLMENNLISDLIIKKIINMYFNNNILPFSINKITNIL